MTKLSRRIVCVSISAFLLGFVLTCVTYFSAAGRTMFYFPLRSYLSAYVNKTAVPEFSKRVTAGDDTKVRVYFIHGLNRSPEQFKSGPFSKLKVDGAQYVFVSLPVSDPSFFNDGGRRYCERFSAWLDETERDLNRLHPVSKRIVVGVSYGGWHAIVGAARHDWIDGYVAFSPVTYIPLLSEYRFQSDLGCSVLSRLPMQPGFVSYSMDDSRVGGVLAASFARLAGAEVSRVDGIGHMQSVEQVIAATRFINRILKRDSEPE